MKVKYTINNYQVGAKLNTTPVHKIVEQNRINKKCVEITYNGVTEREKQFIDKVFARKGVEVQ